MNENVRLRLNFINRHLSVKRYRTPDLPRLVVAFETEVDGRSEERALFHWEVDGTSEVWLFRDYEVTRVLQWVGTHDVVGAPGIAELDRLPDFQYNVALRYLAPLPWPDGFVHAVRMYFLEVAGKERPGRAILAGLMPLNLYEEIRADLCSDGLHIRRCERPVPYFATSPDSLAPEAALEPEFGHVAWTEPRDRHDAALGNDGRLTCCWCGGSAAGVDLRVFTMQECPWKRSTRDAVCKNGMTFPERLDALRIAGERLEGEALRSALRSWFQLGAVSRIPDYSVFRASADFLRWAVAGRVREVLDDLDASGHPLDQRVAAVIRLIGIRHSLCVLGGYRRRKRIPTFIGKELDIPDWVWRKEHLI